MIERVGQVIGFSFPIWKHRQVEIWLCPQGTVIPSHFHRHIDSLLVFLFGRMEISVGGQTRQVRGLFRRRQTTGRIALSARKVPSGVSHSARTLGRFSVFANIEHSHSSRQSACRDFVLVP